MTNSRLSPMAEEMKRAVLDLPGLNPADIDRTLQVIVSCEKVMLEAMRDFVAERVKKRFTEVFSIGFAFGVIAASIAVLLGHLASLL